MLPDTNLILLVHYELMPVISQSVNTVSDYSDDASAHTHTHSHAKSTHTHTQSHILNMGQTFKFSLGRGTPREFTWRTFSVKNEYECL